MTPEERYNQKYRDILVAAQIAGYMTKIEYREEMDQIIRDADQFVVADIFVGLIKMALELTDANSDLRQLVARLELDVEELRGIIDFPSSLDRDNG